MKKTKIEWCDSTWNPITGCKHGCKYCYARRIAKRFGGFEGFGCEKDYKKVIEQGEFYLTAPAYIKRGKGGKIAGAPYPFDFEPTFHAYRLDEPQRWTKPKTIFVCSMADLFGDWVPDEWIHQVFQACLKSPQHRYLFLTKNPIRYQKLMELGKLPNGESFWYGSTITTPDDEFWVGKEYNTFLSIEPILAPFTPMKLPSDYLNFVILGAMTGPGSKKYIPEKETVDNIVKSIGSPVFMKDSLIPVVGEENMRRELPW